MIPVLSGRSNQSQWSDPWNQPWHLIRFEPKVDDESAREFRVLLASTSIAPLSVAGVLLNLLNVWVWAGETSFNSLTFFFKALSWFDIMFLISCNVYLWTEGPIGGRDPFDGGPSESEIRHAVAESICFVFRLLVVHVTLTITVLRLVSVLSALSLYRQLTRRRCILALFLHFLLAVALETAQFAVNLYGSKPTSLIVFWVLQMMGLCVPLLLHLALTVVLAWKVNRSLADLMKGESVACSGQPGPHSLSIPGPPDPTQGDIPSLPLDSANRAAQGEAEGEEEEAQAGSEGKKDSSRQTSPKGAQTPRGKADESHCACADVSLKTYREEVRRKARLKLERKGMVQEAKTEFEEEVESMPTDSLQSRLMSTIEEMQSERASAPPPAYTREGEKVKRKHDASVRPVTAGRLDTDPVKKPHSAADRQDKVDAAQTTLSNRCDQCSKCDRYKCNVREQCKRCMLLRQIEMVVILQEAFVQRVQEQSASSMPSGSNKSQDSTALGQDYLESLDQKLEPCQCKASSFYRRSRRHKHKQQKKHRHSTKQQDEAGVNVSDPMQPSASPQLANTGTPAPVTGQHEAVLPAPVIGQHETVLPAPVIGQHETVLPASIIGQHETVLPAPVIGQHETVLPAPVIGQHETVLPASVIGQHEAVLPAPVIGQHETVLPAPVLQSSKNVRDDETDTSKLTKLTSPTNLTKKNAKRKGFSVVSKDAKPSALTRFFRSGRVSAQKKVPEDTDRDKQQGNLSSKMDCTDSKLPGSQTPEKAILAENAENLGSHPNQDNNDEAMQKNETSKPDEAKTCETLIASKNKPSKISKQQSKPSKDSSTSKKRFRRPDSKESADTSRLKGDAEIAVAKTKLREIRTLKDKRSISIRTQDPEDPEQKDRRERNRQTDPNLATPRSRQDLRLWRARRTTLAVIFISFISFVAYPLSLTLNVFFFLYPDRDLKGKRRVLEAVGLLLQVLNSSINFLIYYYLLGNFRKLFWRRVTYLYCCPDTTVPSQTEQDVNGGLLLMQYQMAERYQLEHHRHHSARRHSHRRAPDEAGIRAEGGLKDGSGKKSHQGLKKGSLVNLFKPENPPRHTQQVGRQPQFLQPQQDNVVHLTPYKPGSMRPHHSGSGVTEF